MGLERTILAVNLLLQFWKKQGIKILPKTANEVKVLQKNKGFELPNDFTELYIRVNGMKTLYPNEIDAEGFLFYPIEAVISVGNEFEGSLLENKEKIFIFAEYMHRSWWYGFERINSEQYIIGIIPDKDTFKPITNSLAEFIELYIEDSSKLYDYS